MGRSYHITPRRTRKNTSASYIANFYNASGARVTRGLGTDFEARALLLCQDLVRLRLEKIGTAADAALHGIDPDAVRLYFSESKAVVRSDFPEASVCRDVFERAKAEVTDLPEKLRHRQFQLLNRFGSITTKAEQLHRALADRTRDRDALQNELDTLKRSVIGKAAQAAARVPPMATALLEYKEFLETAVIPRTARHLHNLATAFVTAHPELKTPADASVDVITGYLQKLKARKLKTRQHKRNDLGRFFNWAAKRWEYPSQMKSVAGVSKNAIDRQRGDIHWHDMDEVEAAIAAAPDAYWQTLIATLGYGGLQLAELCWLRKKDLRLSADGQSGSLWVTVVEESEDVKHDLKTGNRRREVPLDVERLLPRLRAHLKCGAGQTYLFPMPAGVQRRARQKSPGLKERWLTTSLSTVLRGHKGAKDKKTGQWRRKPTSGILPRGMNALSLRRTFGSLCKRAGFSDEEIATLMGNTADVVKDHYARLSGPELLEKRIKFLGRGG